MPVPVQNLEIVFFFVLHSFAIYTYTYKYYVDILILLYDCAGAAGQLIALQRVSYGLYMSNIYVNYVKF